MQRKTQSINDTKIIKDRSNVRLVEKEEYKGNGKVLGERGHPTRRGGSYDRDTKIPFLWEQWGRLQGRVNMDGGTRFMEEENQKECSQMLAIMPGRDDTHTEKAP